MKRDNLLDKESHPQAEALSTTISATPGPVMQYTALAGFPNLVVPALISKASTLTRQDIDRLRLDLSGLDFTKNEMMSYQPTSASIVPTARPLALAGIPANTETLFEEYIAENSSKGALLNDQFSDTIFKLVYDYYKLDMVSAQTPDVYILVNGIKTPLIGIQYYGAFQTIIAVNSLKPNRTKVIGDITS